MIPWCVKLLMLWRSSHNLSENNFLCICYAKVVSRANFAATKLHYHVTGFISTDKSILKITTPENLKVIHLLLTQNFPEKTPDKPT